MASEKLLLQILPSCVATLLLLLPYLHLLRKQFTWSQRIAAILVFGFLIHAVLWLTFYATKAEWMILYIYLHGYFFVMVGLPLNLAALLGIAAWNKWGKKKQELEEKSI